MAVEDLSSITPTPQEVLPGELPAVLGLLEEEFAVIPKDEKPELFKAFTALAGKLIGVDGISPGEQKTGPEAPAPPEIEMPPVNRDFLLAVVRRIHELCSPTGKVEDCDAGLLNPLIPNREKFSMERGGVILKTVFHEPFARYIERLNLAGGTGYRDIPRSTTEAEKAINICDEWLLAISDGPMWYKVFSAVALQVQLPDIYKMSQTDPGGKLGMPFAILDDAEFTVGKEIRTKTIIIENETLRRAMKAWMRRTIVDVVARHFTFAEGDIFDPEKQIDGSLTGKNLKAIRGYRETLDQSTLDRIVGTIKELPLGPSVIVFGGSSSGKSELSQRIPAIIRRLCGSGSIPLEGATGYVKGVHSAKDGTISRLIVPWIINYLEMDKPIRMIHTIMRFLGMESSSIQRALNIIEVPATAQMGPVEDPRSEPKRFLEIIAKSRSQRYKLNNCDPTYPRIVDSVLGLIGRGEVSAAVTSISSYDIDMFMNKMARRQKIKETITTSDDRLPEPSKYISQNSEHQKSLLNYLAAFMQVMPSCLLMPALLSAISGMRVYPLSLPIENPASKEMKGPDDQNISVSSPGSRKLRFIIKVFERIGLVSIEKWLDKHGNEVPGDQTKGSKKSGNSKAVIIPFQAKTYPVRVFFRLVQLLNKQTSEDIYGGGFMEYMGALAELLYEREKEINRARRK